MKRKRKYFGGALVALAAIIGATGFAKLDSNNKNNDVIDTENVVADEILSTNVELSGNTTLLYSGIHGYLNKYVENMDKYTDNTGVTGFYASGITSILNEYGSYLSENVSASIEKLDIATQFVPEGSIIDGYEQLGISKATSYLNVRKGPGTDYKVIGKMPGNCACEIISEDNGWYKIKSGDVEGYVKKDYILTGYEANIKAKEKMETVLRVECNVLNVRENASADSQILSSVANGQTLEIIEELDGWYLIDINNLKGYVSAEYVKEVNSLPTAEKIVEVSVNSQYQNGSSSGSNSGGSSSSSNKKPNFKYENLDNTVSQTAIDLINNAMQYLGNKYVPGGSSLKGGTDCSGFTKFLYAEYGYELPRSASDYVNTKYTLIPMSMAKPGDIVLYNYGSRIGHVAIYMGDGKIIHSSNRKDGVKISTAYYTEPYGALRVIP